jgi:hypothetical protein
MSTTSGAMAQLVAHHTGSVGVRGSNPLSSTHLCRSEGITSDARRVTSTLRFREQSAHTLLRIRDLVLGWIPVRTDRGRSTQPSDRSSAESRQKIDGEKALAARVFKGAGSRQRNFRITDSAEAVTVAL